MNLTLDQYLVVFFLVIMISGFEAISQSFVYLSYKNKSNLYFAVALLFYLVVIILLYNAYKFKGVGYVNVLWSGVTTTFMLLIGYFFFGERLTRIEWIGASFILFGILLMVLHKLFNH